VPLGYRGVVDRVNKEITFQDELNKFTVATPLPRQDANFEIRSMRNDAALACFKNPNLSLEAQQHTNIQDLPHTTG
jgi:hypothetical protein